MNMINWLFGPVSAVSAVYQPFNGGENDEGIYKQ